MPLRGKGEGRGGLTQPAACSSQARSSQATGTAVKGGPAEAAGLSGMRGRSWQFPRPGASRGSQGEHGEESCRGEPDTEESQHLGQRHNHWGSHRPGQDVFPAVSHWVGYADERQSPSSGSLVQPNKASEQTHRIKLFSGNLTVSWNKAHENLRQQQTSTQQDKMYICLASNKKLGMHRSRKIQLIFCTQGNTMFKSLVS